MFEVMMHHHTSSGQEAITNPSHFWNGEYIIPTFMEWENDEITDNHITSLLNELHLNSDKLASLLSDLELRTLFDAETSVQVKRKSKPSLSISTMQPHVCLEPLETANTPKKCFISPYKCNQQTPTSQMSTPPFVPQSPLVFTPYRNSLVPHTPMSAINSKERVEKTIQNVLDSIGKQVSSVLDMTTDENEEPPTIKSHKRLSFESL
jgi:hypothetical protein